MHLQMELRASTRSISCSGRASRDLLGSSLPTVADATLDVQATALRSGIVLNPAWGLGGKNTVLMSVAIASLPSPLRR